MNPFAANHYICPEGYGVLSFLDEAAAAGIAAVGISRAALDEMSTAALSRALRDRGLTITSLNSAGFFTWADAGQRRQQEDVNARLIDAAAELDANALCVITGGMGEQPDIATARGLIADGLAALDEKAAASGVRLGLEPIHPVGVLTKGCVNTIADARAMIDGMTATGLIVDLYHSWWDTSLIDAIREEGEKIRVVQFCNVLLDPVAAPRRSDDPARGALALSSVLKAVSEAGYDGAFEFEIFAIDHDSADIAPLLRRAAAWYETQL